jgi:hypothetical protein
MDIGENPWEFYGSFDDIFGQARVGCRLRDREALKYREGVELHKDLLSQ